MECGFSDHDAITITTPIKRAKFKTEEKTGRNLQKIRRNPTIFQQKLANVEWTDLWYIEDPDAAVDYWNESIKRILDEIAPVEIRRQKNKKERSFNEETKAAMKERNRLKKKMRSAQEGEVPKILEEYKQKRKQVHKLIQTEKWKQLQEEVRSNGLKAAWNVVKQITNPKTKEEEKIEIRTSEGHVTKVEEEVAKEFNQYFIQKIEKLMMGIDKNMCEDPLSKLKDKNEDFTISCNGFSK